MATVLLSGATVFAPCEFPDSDDNLPAAAAAAAAAPVDLWGLTDVANLNPTSEAKRLVVQYGSVMSDLPDAKHCEFSHLWATDGQDIETLLAAGKSYKDELIKVLRNIKGGEAFSKFKRLVLEHSINNKFWFN